MQAFRGACACVRTDPNLSGSCWNEISPVFLRDFIVFMVCIMSTHPPPPPSEQLDKIHLMPCQEVCPPTRPTRPPLLLLYAWVAGFYLFPITRPVHVQWSPAVSVGCKHRERRDWAGITDVGGTADFSSCFIDEDSFHVTDSPPPSAGDSAVLSYKYLLLPANRKECVLLICNVSSLISYKAPISSKTYLIHFMKPCGSAVQMTVCRNILNYCNQWN